MNILVNKNDETKIINKEIISKDIICPICKENILINFDNFKIFNIYQYIFITNRTYNII